MGEEAGGKGRGVVLTAFLISAPSAPFSFNFSSSTLRSSTSLKSVCCSFVNLPRQLQPSKCERRQRDDGETVRGWGGGQLKA